MNRYLVVLAVENSGIEVLHVRDGRSLPQILDAWFAAMDRHNERSARTQRAAMAANIKLQQIQHAVGNLAREAPEEADLPVPVRDGLRLDESLVFSGDVDGIGAAMVLPGVIYAIVREEGK